MSILQFVGCVDCDGRDRVSNQHEWGAFGQEHTLLLHLSAVAPVFSAPARRDGYAFGGVTG
jgi:hypothetical protein